jgi:cytochrome c553
MRCLETLGVLALAFLAWAAAARVASAQGDALAGHKKADVCMTCHGADGLAKIPEAPNLAGQNEAYLIEQLMAFQSGARTNEMMSIVVKPLTEQDIDDLAAYYAGIEIKVGKIPGQ